jgi:hypothetical protein
MQTWQMMSLFDRKLCCIVASTQPGRECSLEIWATWLFFLGSLAVVILCLFDYNINWMHPETFGWQNAILSGTKGLQWSDWAQFFNCDLVGEQCTRARFLSYELSYVDAFYRLWLIQYIPPHPSLSVGWFFSVTSLYFLYRTIFELTRDRSAALLSTGLYALSAGFLSNMLLSFHPAKPLAAFFVNFCLFLSIKIWQSPSIKVYSPIAILLYVCLLLAYSSDETTWILAFVIPVLCPHLLDRRHWPLLTCIVLTFPLFLALVTWGAPVFIRKFWGHEFYFWSWAFNVGAVADHNSPPLLARISVSAMWAEALNMAESQYAWWKSGETVAAVSLLPIAGGISVAAAFAAREKRELLVRVMISLLMFTVFECLILFRHYTAYGTYYYGALFSNFSLLVVGVAIASLGHIRMARVMSMCAVVYLGYVSFTWFTAFNKGVIAYHNRIYAEVVGNEFGPLDPRATLTATKVIEYWRAVQMGQDVRSLQSAFAFKDVWLFTLMDAWRRREPLPVSRTPN